MTEPCRLPFPDDIIMALRHPRGIRVHEHWIRVNPAWWDAALTARCLPGGPLHVTYDEAHHAGISRGALFKLALDESTDGVLRLLWHTLAWVAVRRHA
jgi:hypothetical protein